MQGDGMDMMQHCNWLQNEIVSARWEQKQRLHDCKELETFERCAACLKLFSSMQDLEEHIEKAGHSQHEARCGACNKHCFCFEALREHLHGRLAKKNCASEFARRGCHLCLNFLESEDALANHRLKCQYVSASPCQEASTLPSDGVCERMKAAERDPESFVAEPLCSSGRHRTGAVALDCEMVGGGKDGSVDLCGRLCLVDEHENVLLHTYVYPYLPVTDYRFEITGIEAAHLKSGMPFKRVRRAVKAILGDRRLLVGHDLRHDLACLRMDYPQGLLRDTATYQMFVKTSGVSHKLRFLTETYLGYKIQNGISHDPCEDAVAAIRLYKRMCSQRHDTAILHNFNLSQLSLQEGEVSERSVSTTYRDSHFYCWCLDLKQVLQGKVASAQS